MAGFDVNKYIGDTKCNDSGIPGLILSIKGSAMVVSRQVVVAETGHYR